MHLIIIILKDGFGFTYGCCSFCRKVEASKVGVTYAIIDKAVAADALIVGDGKIGAGIEVDEEEHVDDGLEQPKNVLIVTDLGIYSAEEFAKGPVFQ